MSLNLFVQQNVWQKVDLNDWCTLYERKGYRVHVLSTSLCQYITFVLSQFNTIILYILHVKSLKHCMKNIFETCHRSYTCKNLTKRTLCKVCNVIVFDFCFITLSQLLEFLNSVHYIITLRLPPFLQSLSVVITRN